MFKVDDIVICVKECTTLSIGRSYKVIDPSCHTACYGYPTDPVIDTCVIDDDGRINGYGNDRFKLHTSVHAIVDYLSITKDICSV